jgi:hypothetical protein
MEKRLIDANEIEDLFYKQVKYGATDLMDAFDDALQDAQTVDAVEVVRCKDCQYCDMYQSEADHSSIPICMLHSFEVVDANGFCYRGERKGNAM